MLQLALDTTNLHVALDLAQAVYPYYDIVEIGTPLIIEEGLRALEVLKAKWPHKQFLADLKIMDAGELESASAFRRGADLVTVLALADDKTIIGALAAAEKYKGLIMVDMINVPNPVARARELQSLGVQIVCIHTAHDVQGDKVDLMEDMQRVREVTTCRIALAGGLKLESVNEAVACGANILVVGSSITADPTPGEVAAEFIARIEEACP